ncbi:MAG: tetratricopeptide repeat protein [Smithella sp.]|jgi:tetratricopeptide (TPR) repeat protein
MKICRKCQEEFHDRVPKCLYCGGPLEVISSPQQIVKPSNEKQGGAKLKKMWKDYRILIIGAIIIAVGILFAISQTADFQKSVKLTTEIKPAKAVTPAVSEVQEPAPAANQAQAPGLVNNLLNNAFDLCSSGKCTDPQKAIEYLDEAIKLKPDFAEAFNNRGNAYSDLGQYPRAIEDYNEAIRLKPQYAHAYYNRGFTYDDLGQYQLAIEDYNEAIRLKPEHIDAYYNRGNDYFLQNNKELGCRDAQKACELGGCKLLEKAKSKKYCVF